MPVNNMLALYGLWEYRGILYNVMVGERMHVVVGEGKASPRKLLQNVPLRRRL